ncbi:hypothetical protein F0M17_06080 [Glutamicibacter sp. ZJUTW]|nr:hypothetical protein F0M17_06080 [Glutamicibacter sp. ZJUTW]
MASEATFSRFFTRITELSGAFDYGFATMRHYTENRTRAHVFLGMLTGRLTWHLRTAVAELPYNDEDKPVCVVGVGESCKLLAMPTATRHRVMELIADQLDQWNSAGVGRHGKGETIGST